MNNYLVIGASSGIGLSLANTLAQQGHNVFGTYNKTAIDNTSAIQYHPLNVLEEEINLDFLPETIDGIAYCPGSINLAPFKRIRPEAFKQDYDLQVVGAVKIIQHILPKLKATGNSSILLFSTVAVQTGFNFHSQVAASKGALEGLTKALAAEFAPTIRVNAIAPSITNTPLAEKYLNSDVKIEANTKRHPLKKIGEPEDVAHLAAYLLSNKAAWLTGQIIKIDGGISSLRI